MSEPRPKGKDTRIRSEEELAQQGRDLAAVRDVLATRGVTAVLSDGALLGAAREGDFIEWDWDAELFLFHDEVRCLGPQMADDRGAAGSPSSNAISKRDTGRSTPPGRRATILRCGPGTPTATATGARGSACPGISWRREAR